MSFPPTILGLGQHPVRQNLFLAQKTKAKISPYRTVVASAKYAGAQALVLGWGETHI